MPDHGVPATAAQSVEYDRGHFTFSHLWWAIAYQMAKFTGSQFPGQNFLFGVLSTLSLLVVVLLWKPKTPQK